MTELIELENNLILVSLLITVCMQLSFFAVAYTLKIDKVTDFAGASNFIVLAAFTLWLGNDFSLPKMLATLMVCLWGFRLFILSNINLG
jgi:steroid 5-alpha reductase family enzyme